MQRMRLSKRKSAQELDAAYRCIRVSLFADHGGRKVASQIILRFVFNPILLDRVRQSRSVEDLSNLPNTTLHGDKVVLSVKYKQ